MATSMTDEGYTCSLNNFYEEKAQQEINEDPKNREGAVETFRQWIKTQPHITCITDSEYLLKFLRVAKFSQLLAQEYLTNFLKQMGKKKEWMTNIDTADPKIQAFLSAGYMTVLPKRDKEGRPILLMRLAAFDPHSKAYDKNTMIRTMVAVLLYLLQDESIQVSGMVYFLDMSGYERKHEKFLSLGDLRQLYEIWQRAFPARYKGFHYYNHGIIFENLYAIIKTFVSKKFRERIFLHGNNLENVYSVVPPGLLPDEYLSDDYEGPSAGNIQTLIGNIKQKLLDQDVRERVLTETNPSLLHLDESLIPNNIPAASYRKLNVD